MPIGARLDQAALNVLGAHHAAQAVARFEECVSNVSTLALRTLQAERGAEPADASADDGDPCHRKNQKLSSRAMREGARQLSASRGI
jgi:hypothetical protein